MVYIHANAVGHLDLEWVMYAISLLVSALPDEILLIRMRGFGGRRFGFGRGRGSFRLLRILFVLLFTTVLGPIVLVTLVAVFAYSFLSSRHRR